MDGRAGLVDGSWRTVSGRAPALPTKVCMPPCRVPLPSLRVTLPSDGGVEFFLAPRAPP